jgi:hypothetical protein
MTVLILMEVFWIVTLYGVVGGYQRFRGMLPLSSHWRGDTFLWNIGTKSHSIKTQKNTIDIFTAMRTSDLIFNIS